MPVPTQHATYWCAETSLGRLEMLRARYTTQCFAPHTHEGHAFGVIEEGALCFRYHGEQVVAPAGAINCVNPGESHTGHAGHETGWVYRMFYLDHALLRRLASDVADRPQDVPYFGSGVIDDPRAADLLRRAHRALDDPNTPNLEREGLILAAFERLLTHHAADHPTPRRVGREDGAVALARDYIDTHSAENVSLNDLARVAHLSPYHLARVFARQVGLPPHAYLTQTRVRRAQDLLTLGWTATSVAHEVGFADQSHLNKVFRRILGLTPVQYRVGIIGTPPYKGASGAM